jgi:hypothetical protein
MINPPGKELFRWAGTQKFYTFDGAKPRFLNWGKKRRSVSTLSIPRASDRGVEWVDYWYQFSLLKRVSFFISIDGVF